MREKLTRDIAFGWGAEPFAKQLPELPAEDAAAFDEDNRAIIRLSARGLISSSERDKAIRRTTKAIGETLSALRSPASEASNG